MPLGHISFMIILPAKLSELTGSSKANSTGSSLANSSPRSTQTRQNKQTEHNQPRANSNNMMQTWYAMRDAICDAYARFDKECMNLASTWKSKCATGKVRRNRLKRYKERRNRSYGLEMASNSNMTPVCDLQQVAI